MPSDYYDHLAQLDQALAECRAQDTSVAVGYIGGESALRQAGLSALEGRKHWKVRYPLQNPGKVIEKNWIKGPSFLNIVHGLRG